NNRHLNGGNSPHNMYLSLTLELGLVGLLLYLAWLAAVWRESARLIKIGRLVRDKSRALGAAGIVVQPLVVAMMVGSASGELIYIYRPSFAFMGMFLFLMAILNHPLLARDAQVRKLIERKPARGTRVAVQVAGAGRNWV